MKALRNSSPYLRAAICAAIFLLAFSVRSLTWHDTRFEVGKVQSSVAGDYQRVAELLRQEGIRGFFSSSSSLADLNNLGHPPGYSFLIALVRAIFGSSNAAVQFTQILFDSFAAVLLFLIVLELFSLAPATIAGLFAALSPQLAWNSVLLLPDSLATFPILLAVFLLARSREKPRLTAFVMIGALVGLSCWLRANAMLLAPFLAVAVLLLLGKKQWRYSLAVIAGTLLIVLPLTIRNAIATRHFIPVSLGAGQTLLEGIADYDTNNRFGIPNTDMGIMRQEAEIYQRPDYYGTLFNPDGVERERARLSRGFTIIRSHPFWFAGVMGKRASTMLRLERSRLISTYPPISHPIGAIKEKQPVWSAMPDKLLAAGVVLSPLAQTSLVSDTCCWLALIGDGSRYGDQFASETVMVDKDVDYVLLIPIAAISGRMRVSVRGLDGKIYSTAVVEALEPLTPSDQSLQKIALPFVARENGSLQIVFSNEASNPSNPVVSLTEVELYELGPARFLWTRYLRIPLRAIQSGFITAVFLPLAMLGFAVTIFRRRKAALLILSVVPIYYFAVQSAFHTEYRYVLAVNYFLFTFAAVTIGWLTGAAISRLGIVRFRKSV